MSYLFTEGYKIRDQYATHFLTFTVGGWIDLFSNQRYRDILIESMKFCQKYKGLQIHAFVIMTNHIHVIWTARNGLSKLVQDYKSFTSKEILKSIESDPENRREWLLYMFEFFAKPSNKHDKYRVWTPNNHPEEILTKTFFDVKLDYI